jgi:hypothetical protein
MGLRSEFSNVDWLTTVGGLCRCRRAVCPPILEGVRDYLVAENDFTLIGEVFDRGCVDPGRVTDKFRSPCATVSWAGRQAGEDHRIPVVELSTWITSSCPKSAPGRDRGGWTSHCSIAGRTTPVSRRGHHDPQRRPRLPQGREQPRRQRTHRRVRQEPGHRR